MSNSTRNCCSWISSMSFHGTRRDRCTCPEYGKAGNDAAPPKAGWIEHEGGVADIGHTGNGFGFDNEFPRHQAYLTPFALADRPVTCGEWLSFMEDGGYSRPEFWLSDGWAVVMTQGWAGPPVLVPPSRRAPTVAAVHPLGSATRRSRRARLSCQLLRGGCLRALDREAPAYGGRMGDNRRRRRRGNQLPRSRCAPSSACPHHQRTPRRCLGVDVERLHGVSGIPRGTRCRRRVQREVHGEPIRAARGMLRHSPRTYACHVSELLPARSSLGLQWSATGPGPLTDHDLHHRRARHPRRSPSAHAGRCHRGPPGGPQIDPARLVLRRAWKPALRGDHPAARVLPDPRRAAPTGNARIDDRRTLQSGHPRRARRWVVREDPGPPQRTPRSRHPEHAMYPSI